MSVHTKKLPIRVKNSILKPPFKKKNTENIKLSIFCPVANAGSIKQYLEKQGCILINDEQELINARELFAERTPSNMLIGARSKENITQIQLSELTGIPRRHISDMENGRRPIGKQNAIKLGEALNINYRLFL